eukprot:699201-Pelagomonas_calceolata.AAC.1
MNRASHAEKYTDNKVVDHCHNELWPQKGWATSRLWHMAGKKKKSGPAKRPRALRKGSLTSKLAKVSPKGPQT